MVLGDALDRLAELALDVGVACQVALHGALDALELALDDALARLAAGRQEHLAVAALQPLLGVPERSGRHAQAVVQRPGHRQDRSMRGGAGQVGQDHQHHDRQQRRGCGERELAEAHGMFLRGREGDAHAIAL